MHIWDDCKPKRRTKAKEEEEKIKHKQRSVTLNMCYQKR